MLRAVVHGDRKTGDVGGGPEVITRGWVYAPEAEDLLDEAREAVRAAVSAVKSADVDTLRNTAGRAPGKVGQWPGVWGGEPRAPAAGGAHARAARRCVACVTNGDCTGDDPVCDVVTGLCGAGDCGRGGADAGAGGNCASP